MRVRSYAKWHVVFFQVLDLCNTSGPRICNNRYDAQCCNLAGASGGFPPTIGEIYVFGYKADGCASTEVVFGVVNRDGSLKSEQSFDAPCYAMMHVFCMSEHHALFPIYPTTANLYLFRSSRQGLGRARPRATRC